VSVEYENFDVERYSTGLQSLLASSIKNWCFYLHLLEEKAEIETATEMKFMENYWRGEFLNIRKEKHSDTSSTVFQNNCV
jgi:hypothetical protein